MDAKNDFGNAHGACSLDATLARLFDVQRSLRELLENTRSELDRVNEEILRLQDEFCTDPQSEEEYLKRLQKVLGYDPHLDLKEIESPASNGQTVHELIAAIEAEAGPASSRKAE